VSRLLVYAGPNGSGKSTLRERLGQIQQLAEMPLWLVALRPRIEEALSKMLGMAPSPQLPKS
jgi:hypothetical protein